MAYYDKSMYPIAFFLTCMNIICSERCCIYIMDFNTGAFRLRGDRADEAMNVLRNCGLLKEV